jgi:hypothetical protein
VANVYHNGPQLRPGGVDEAGYRRCESVLALLVRLSLLLISVSARKHDLSTSKLLYLVHHGKHGERPPGRISKDVSVRSRSEANPVDDVSRRDDVSRSTMLENIDVNGNDLRVAI